MAKPTMCDMDRVKRIGRCFVGKPRARCWFRWQQSGELGAYSDADWGGDKATRRSMSAGVIMRGGHCFKVWTKKQQVVSLSTAESKLYAAVKTASEGLGVQSVAKDLEIACGLNLHMDASVTVCLVNRGGLGKVETRRHAQPVYTGGIRVRKARHPADLMTKPLPIPKIEQLRNIMGYELVEQCLKRAEAHGMRLVGSLTKKPGSWAPPQQNETRGNSQWCC